MARPFRQPLSHSHPWICRKERGKGKWELEEASVSRKKHFGFKPIKKSFHKRPQGNREQSYVMEKSLGRKVAKRIQGKSNLGQRKHLRINLD